MSITERTCANCAKFNPPPRSGDVPSCWDGAALGLTREPEAGDTCLAHVSFEEDIAEDQLLHACAELAGPLFASEQAEGIAATRMCLRKAAQL